MIEYNTSTGVFYRIFKNGKRQRAGTLKRDGYLCMAHGVRVVLAHRLAWFLVHGKWPCSDLDHANGDRADNRIDNLRLATREQNARNARGHHDVTSGMKGAYFDQRKGRWYSCISIDDRNKFLGYFDTAEAAHVAYGLAAVEAFGEFARLR